MADANVAGTILVVDDEYAMRLSCQKILAKAGYRVETFSDGAQGLAGVARLKPDAVVVDLKMPGLSGLEVISRIHEVDPEIIIIVITGYATIDTAVDAMRRGAWDFLPKPFSPDELRLIVNRGLERRRLALDAHRLELERAVLKRRFVTFVSHQLQTPLIAVHQYLQLLRRTEESGGPAEKRKEWIERSLKRTEELLRLIRDWLTLARVEGNTLAVERVKLDLKQILSGLVCSYEEMAAAREVRLQMRLGAQDYFTLGDRNCVSVVFDNLIGNAIKYNRRGGEVTVAGYTRNGEVVVSVSDTGIGIPGEYQGLLFDEFFRIPGNAAKDVGGSGLGLHIAKKIITEMGGAIAVDSKPGEGSTFRVHVPEYRGEAGTPDQDHEHQEAHINRG